MNRRLETMATALTNALHVLPVAGAPGYPTSGQIADGLAVIFSAHCRPMERLTCACAGVLSLDRATREELAEAVLADLRVGRPKQSTTILQEEARAWSARASSREVRAYLCAIWGRLPEAERAGFLNAVGTIERATA